MMRRTSSALTALALGASLVVAGCSGDDGDEDGDDSTTASSLSGGFSVTAALAELPPPGTTEGKVLVLAADIPAASKAAGTKVPTDGSREATTDWFLKLSNDPEGPVFVPFADAFNVQSASPDEFAEVAGWSVLDVDSFVEYAVPPHNFTVVSGDFDDHTLSEDLIEVGDEVVTDREGDDLSQDLADPSPLNNLGSPTRFGQRGDLIALGRHTTLVKEWLSGPDQTLADDDSFAAIAEALDDEEVVSAVLSSIEGGPDLGSQLGRSLSPEQLKAIEREFEDLVPEDSFDAVGIGWGVDDGEPEINVAYHFSTDDQAHKAAPVLERSYREGSSAQGGIPWSDRMTVDEVDADGSVVTVTVSPTEAGNVQDLFNALTTRDSLFLSR